MRGVRRRIAATSTYRTTNTDIVDPTQLLVMLTGLVAESPTDRHTVALLCGAQHGFALHGYHLDLPSELPFMVGPGLTTSPFTSETATRIRAHVAHPVRAGALATALFTGLGYSALVSIPITALSDDADVLEIGSRRLRASGAFAVPPSALPLLTAARAFQTMRGADRQRSLFRGGLGHHSHYLRHCANACGLTLPARQRWEEQWHARVTASPLTL